MKQSAPPNVTPASRRWSTASGGCKPPLLAILSAALCASALSAFIPPSAHSAPSAPLDNFSSPPSPLSIRYVAPTRLLWHTENLVDNVETLTRSNTTQATLPKPMPPAVLRGADGKGGAFLIDFGRELAGGIEIFTPIQKDKKPVRVRVRFGESAAEAMSDVGGEHNATNDHAMRDFETDLPWLGRKRIGDTGFRFVRIDLADLDRQAHISGIRAYLRIRDIPYLGSFRSSDERLNKIWDTGAYTVHLNMQDYLWDGVKRDRLVWMGDMHPEVRAIATVFGRNPVVEDSLDLSRDVTPLPDWMCGISSYSMWWVLIHEEWLRLYGDKTYLEEQRGYLTDLLKRLAGFVNQDGGETLDGNRFLDWPTAGNKPAVHAGLQSLLILTLEAGERLCRELDDPATAKTCGDAAQQLRKHIPDHGGVKQPAALMVMAGLADPKTTSSDVLQKGGSEGLSTFYGYYVLEALAEAQDYQAGLDLIRDYWGGMLDLGATSFWEHFDVAWKENAGRIDELPSAGTVNVHETYGEHCYVGYRHSLCHGWAAGPTIWLTEHILGIRALDKDRIRLTPHLGDLDWAEGTCPTPHGVLHVRHERTPNGEIKTTVNAPDGLTVLRK